MSLIKALCTWDKTQSICLFMSNNELAPCSADHHHWLQSAVKWEGWLMLALMNIIRDPCQYFVSVAWVERNLCMQLNPVR